MRRRAALGALLVLGAGAPLVRAQRSDTAPRATARIGFLASASEKATTHFRKALLEGLAERGWVEGENLKLAIRYADGKAAQHDPLAQELVAPKPDLIVAPSTPGAVAVRKLTRTIPIVFVVAADPVGEGLAQSLARPGLNATGLTVVGFEIIGKRLELLREALPSIARVAVLHHARDAVSVEALSHADRIARTMGISVEPVAIDAPAGLGAAFAALARARPDAALVLTSPGFYIHRAELAKRMAEVRVPAMYGAQAFASVGGLMAYAPNYVAQFRQAADYVDRILRGADPGELPIRQPTTFEFVVNLRSAKALGLEFPQSILLRADRVIE